jgi:hypothetical protein
MYPNKPRYGRQINTYVVIMFVDVGVSSFAYPLELLVATRIYLSLCHCRRVSLVLNLYDVFASACCFKIMFLLSRVPWLNSCLTRCLFEVL